MRTVRLVGWKPEIARERAEELKRAGVTVDASALNPPGWFKHFRANPPAVVLIDLDRLPSHGREVAVSLRTSKWTRHIPIVFAGGTPEKVERIRRELPDAFFTEWSGAARVLKKALRTRVLDPVKPVPHMERWAGSPLDKKLGCKAGMQIALLGAPEGFEENLPGVEIQSRISAATGLAVWFVRSRRELEAETEFVAARLPKGGSLWIVHPKQAGGHRADFNQNDVRAVGLAAGLVDYKVCAVDADWSGLKFARKKG